MKRLFRIRPRRLAALPLVALLALGGCAGYHLGGELPQAMQGVKTIAVPAFRNDSLYARVEALAAGSVVREFQRDASLEVRAQDEADAVLAGKVVRISRRGARGVHSDIVKQQEYNLTVTLEYTVTRRGSREVLAHGQVRGQTSFFVSGGDVNQDERQAIPLALEVAARRLVARVTTGW